MIAIERLKKRILDGGSITPKEAVELAQYEDKEALYQAADALRAHFTGQQFNLCSIINARSGKCPEDCQWCAQSAFHNTTIDTYELVDEQEAVRQACENAKKGVHRYSLVTSGKALSAPNLDRLIGVYCKIQAKSDIGLCASMGLLDKARLQKLKDTGIEHYHCNLETARSHFPKLCTTHTYDQKINTIKWAQEVGLKVCSGGIIGMGETMGQRIELAFELKNLGINSVPLNILNPVKGTPLEGKAPLTDEEVLVTFALFRFINPKASIRFAGGRLQIRHIQEKALKAGINAALTGDLLTTIGSNVDEDVRDFKAAGFKL